MANQIAEIGRLIRIFLDDFLDWHGVNGDVGSRNGLLDIVSIEEGSTRRNRCQVPYERIGVNSDNNILFIASSQVTVFAGTNCVPSGQALNVGREKVLARDGDAHLENYAQDSVVGG